MKTGVLAEIFHDLALRPSKHGGWQHPDPDHDSLPVGRIR
jgi:hypothetical protein